MIALSANTTQSIFLSLPNPNGMNPIKPPTANLVSDFPEDNNEPTTTMIKPRMITKIPIERSCVCMVTFRLP